MLNRYLVLDQNKLRAHRAPEVVQLLTSSPETHFVLPDIAFVEMTKNPEHRADNVKASLKLLAPFYQRVHIARGIGDSLTLELDKRKSSAKHMLFSEGTVFARNILRAMNANIDEAELRKIRMDPDKHHDALAKDYFSHISNKERLSGLIAAMKEMLGRDFQKNLRANRVSKSDLLNVIHAQAPALLWNILQTDLKMSPGKAWSLIKQKPLLLRYYYSKMWLCIDWIKNGGFESIDAEKISNDLIDHEYILTATCFSGFVTADNRASEAHTDMVTLLSQPARRPR